MSEKTNEELLQESNEKIEELEKQLLYAKAEAENIRRRGSEDVIKANKFALDKFSTEIITVKDSLEAGIKITTKNVKEYKNGMELTLKQLNQVFEKFNIKEINPLKELFDPNKHQTISMEDSEEDLNIVTNVLQKGYELNDRLIRPALVIVSNGNKQKLTKGE